MRKRIFLDSRGGVGGFVELPDGSSAKTLDVVLYNFASKKLEIVNGDNWSASSYPKFNDTSNPENSTSGFYPVGVVVIPGSHGVLKDGSGTVNQCGVMSIVPMDCNTPEKGGTVNRSIYWGGYGTDISGKSDELGRFDSVTNGLTNYDVVNYVGFNGSVTEKTLGVQYYGFLPIDAVSKVKNPYDNKTWYPYDDYEYAPSPYQNNGSYNTAYGQTTSPARTSNALSDFKGIVNTKIITDLAKSQSDWRTASTITEQTGSTYYPAACCCARFKTPGTKAFVDCSIEELRNGTGFWYMPAMGELGYMIVRKNAIGDTISKLKTAYGVGVQVANENWTSSEYDSDCARRVFASDGFIDYLYKYNSIQVRAFMRL